MKAIWTKIIPLFVVAALLSACTKTYSKEEIDKLFEPITSKYGITIVYEIGNDFLSPVETTGPPPGPSKKSIVEQIEGHVLAQYPAILQSELERYPVQVVKDNLTSIYFAKMIEDEIKIAGSYDPYRKIIYLVNDGKQDKAYSKSVFHHEFSSILLKNYGFLLNPWLNQNSRGSRYFYEEYGNLSNVLKHTDLTVTGTEMDYEKGFMNTYGQTNFENDFNEYSAMIFTYPDKFRRIMDQYPRVRAKFLVWLEFYQKIDPIFTEDYLLGQR